MSTAQIVIEDSLEIPELEDILIPGSLEQKEPFIIDTPEKSAWAARKIIDGENRIQQYTDQAKEYKKRIDSWFQKAVQREMESVNYLKTIVRPFIEQEISRQVKSKTIRYPGLSIQLRKKPDRVEITDTDIALSFCEANHPDAVVVKKSLSKSFLKNLLAKKGEIIPGTSIVPGYTELYFKDE